MCPSAIVLHHQSPLGLSCTKEITSPPCHIRNICSGLRTNPASRTGRTFHGRHNSTSCDADRMVSRQCWDSDQWRAVRCQPSTWPCRCICLSISSFSIRRFGLWLTAPCAFLDDIAYFLGNKGRQWLADDVPCPSSLSSVAMYAAHLRGVCWENLESALSRHWIATSSSWLFLFCP